MNHRRASEAPENAGYRAELGRSLDGPSICWPDPFERLALGQRFHSGERTVSEADVIGFCALTGDWHPQHCDPRWAAASPFGERIAHGMLVLSYAAGLVPFDPERVLALRRVSDVVFKRPVRLGEAISVAGEISALRPIDGHSGLVDLRWTIRNQDDALVARATVQVLWRRAARTAVEGATSERSREPVLAGGRGGEKVPVLL